MGTLMRKNLMNLCFANFKRSVPIQFSSVYQKDEDEDDEDSRSLSHAGGGNSVIVKNFNSIYDLISDQDPVVSTSKPPTRVSASDPYPDPDSPDVTPDFATVQASRRFFFSSPGRSNSIIDSSSSSSSCSPSTSNSPVDPPESDSGLAIDGGVAVPTYSPDPYLDFRRSMQEMVEARCKVDVSSNWEWLHELLLCYLALNHKSTHKFIVGAFEDLLASLKRSPPAT